MGKLYYGWYGCVVSVGVGNMGGIGTLLHIWMCACVSGVVWSLMWVYR